MMIAGEWWKSDINKIFNRIQVTGDLVPQSDAFTINGFPGDLYNCSQDCMSSSSSISSMFQFLYFFPNKKIT